MFKVLFFLLFALSPLAASIVKIPQKEAQDIPYQNIPCSDLDKARIYEIIATMGENSPLILFTKQGRLKELGAHIAALHPLKFLTSIFTVPYLKSCMIGIYDDYFKHNGFMDGLAPSLTRESEKGKLVQYVDGFAEELIAANLRVTPEQILLFIQEKDWEALVRYLIGS